MPTHQTRLLTSARILHAAALYVEQHGYYLPLYRLEGDDPDFDWDSYDQDSDLYDRHSPMPTRPAASHQGALIIVIYGRPCQLVFTYDTRRQYEEYGDAIYALSRLYFGPDEHYDRWVFPHELAAAYRAAAAECEYHAAHAAPTPEED